MRRCSPDWHRSNQGVAAYRTLALRWNGAAWQTLATPNVGNGYNELYAVSAPSSDDVWAVGYSRQDQYSPTHPLALHWNGASWQVASTGVPDPGQLLATSALSADEAWAVGSRSVGATGQPLALHWDGVQWSATQVPNPSTYYTVLTGVSAITPDDVWAVGYTHVGERYVTLTEHWNGHGWAVESTPNPGLSPALFGAAAGDGVIWAVGLSNDGGSDRTLSLRATVP